jgi:hypothetical protein
MIKLLLLMSLMGWLGFRVLRAFLRVRNFFTIQQPHNRRRFGNIDIIFPNQTNAKKRRPTSADDYTDFEEVK